MASLVSYTTYVPGIPVRDQIEALSEPKYNCVDLFGIRYIIEVVSFKPLKVNETTLVLTLIRESAIPSPEENSAVGSLEENDLLNCRKYTFFIKSKDNKEINNKKIPVKEIEATITKLFQSSVH